MFRKTVVLVVLGSLGTATWFAANTSEAQVVSVSPGGGVRVRAPFVRVDVSPYGGVSVRAPFAAVDVGGRPRYDGPRPMMMERSSARPSFSTSQELAAMDDETLLQTMRLTADRLHDRLNRFNTGDTWQRYLRLPNEVLSENASGELGQRDAVAKVLERFRNTSVEQRYRMISDLPAFIAMQAVLTEMISRRDGTSSAVGGRPEVLPTPRFSRPSNEGIPPLEIAK